MIDVKAYGGVDVRSLVSVMQLLLPLEKSSTFTDEVMLHLFLDFSRAACQSQQDSGSRH
jgi:hypothetical protein